MKPMTLADLGLAVAVPNKRGPKTKPIKHGTSYAYSKRGCRCMACSLAASAGQRASRERALASGAKDNPADPRHGTAAFYSKYACRCARCTDAFALSRKKDKTSS